MLLRVGLDHSRQLLAQLEGVRRLAVGQVARGEALRGFQFAELASTLQLMLVGALGDPHARLHGRFRLG